MEIEVLPGHDLTTVKDRIRNAVDAIETLPEAAEKPRIAQLINTEEVKVVIVWGDLSERELKEFAEEVRNDLQDLPEVSLVEVFNARPYEISVEVSEKQLRKHGLTLTDISHAIQQSSRNESTGSLRLEGEEIRIRTLGKRYLAPEFENIVVNFAQ